MIPDKMASLRMTGLLMLTDLVSLVLVWSGSVWGRYVFGGHFEPSLYWGLAPCLGLFLTANALFGLYPGILLSPPDELKKLAQATTIIFLALSVAVFLSRQGEVYSRGIFVIAWVGAIILLPMARALLRWLAHGRTWWGQPAVILGAGKTGAAVAAALSQGRRLGLRCIAFLDDDQARIGTQICGVAVAGDLDQAGQYRDAVAIVAMPGIAPSRLVEILEGPASTFRRLIIIPDLFGASSLWVTAFDVAGIIGLEVRQKLLDPGRRAVKRIMELTVIVVFLPLLVPLLMIIALLIRLDSAGPILFRHNRIGYEGREISILKFRTMVCDADTKLQECLAQDPALRAEWDCHHKLTHDPRITRLGHFLRKTSLDELPQLWNVLRGDLSLVGPRPIVWAEVDKYEGGFELYKKVKPGLTGLWQISGRSDTTYAERVRLDAYYVRNWSVWFDIYILSKTPLVVLRGRGAC